MLWSPHIQAICSKAKKVLGLLYRKFYGCANTDTLAQLYISLDRPHLEYACPVWAPYMAKDIHAIESVQKFACKVATRNWNSGYDDLLSLLELPTLERRRLELKLGQLFKIVHNLCYFPMILLNLGSKHLFLTILVLFTLFFTFINRELTLIHIFTRLYHIHVEFPSIRNG